MRRATAVELALLMTVVAGCSREDARLQRHQQNFESLEATTKVVAEAWLSGDVSGTYTRTALEQTFFLVEQERSALASSPRSLQDPRGAALSRDVEDLSRLIASVIADVRAADGAAARRRLAALSIVPQERR